MFTCFIITMMCTSVSQTVLAVDGSGSNSEINMLQFKCKKIFKRKPKNIDQGRYFRTKTIDANQLAVAKRFIDISAKPNYSTSFLV